MAKTAVIATTDRDIKAQIVAATRNSNFSPYFVFSIQELPFDPSGALSQVVGLPVAVLVDLDVENPLELATAIANEPNLTRCAGYACGFMKEPKVDERLRPARRLLDSVFKRSDLFDEKFWFAANKRESSRWYYEWPSQW
jgi:hypothetical protein